MRARGVEFARVEPELGPTPGPEAPSTVVEGVFPEIGHTPQRFGSAPRDAPPIFAPSRRALAERLRAGSVLYLLLVGLVAVATAGVFFGVAFFLLAQPKDKTVVAEGRMSPAMEEAVSTATDTPRAGDAPTPIVASAEPPPAPDPAAPSPVAPLPPVSANPAAAEPVAPPGESTRPASADRRSIARSAPPRGRSANHHRQPTREKLATRAENQRTLSAAMDRAHHENFADPFQSLTPPPAGTSNPFDQLITQLTGPKKPAGALTPPQGVGSK